jgi:hypothetical protein
MPISHLRPTGRDLMSQILHRYRRLLDRGYDHQDAVLELARQLDVDRHTVDRVIRRAQQNEHQPRRPIKETA